MRLPVARAWKALLFTAAALTVGFASAPSHAEDKTIKVGIMGGEDEDVWKVVAEEGKKHGLNIERITFNDYNQPNEALSARKSTPTHSSTSPIWTSRLQAARLQDQRCRLYRSLADRHLFPQGEEA